MIAFNYFSNEIRKQEQQLSHIADRYLNIIKQTYLLQFLKSVKELKIPNSNPLFLPIAQ